MKFSRSAPCPLCGQKAHIVAGSAPGYSAGRQFVIQECEGCLSSHASPLGVNDAIYGHIYSNIRYVPGYNRYYLYANEVLRQKSPLNYLSRQEDSYWAVARHLRGKRSTLKVKTVLEVGCGLGYFTYALAKDGFMATGVDISTEAIDWARGHYGPNYEKATLQELMKQGSGFDVVVMNQLIEHLPDVHGFLDEALALLAPEGDLVLTTPNKTAFPNAEWESDLPPVHLWWFGEEAIRYLARRHGCTVAFIDFAPFYAAHFRPKEQPLELKDRLPILDEQGRVIDGQEIPSVSSLKRALDRSGALEVLRTVRGVLKGKQRWHGAHGPIIAAVLRRTR